MSKVKEKMPHYCTNCGGEIVLKGKRISRYDYRTGKPRRIEYAFICRRLVGIGKIINFSSGCDDYVLDYYEDYNEIRVRGKNKITR